MVSLYTLGRDSGYGGALPRGKVAFAKGCLRACETINSCGRNLSSRASRTFLSSLCIFAQLFVSLRLIVLYGLSALTIVI